VTDELIALLPMLRCLPRRINRISGALEASGIMAVLMLGLHGGPSITRTMSLYAFFDYCLLVVAAILAVRVLVLVFRPDTS
jgi:ubiquinone biosynthesis protein